MFVFTTILFLAIGLAMDAFAVSLGIGTCCQVPSLRGKLRLTAHFGIFQAGMTALGWVVGETVVNYVKDYDHWVAAILLGYVGLNLIRSGLSADRKAFEEDPSTGKTMVMLSIATSIDAFAVGLSIVMMQIPVLASVVAIGVVAFLLSMVGISVGARLGKTFGKKMEVVGGIILVLIGIRVLFTHLFG